MSRLILTVVILVAALCSCGPKKPPPGLPVLSRKYLGQTLPSDRPLMFAQGIVSTGMYERDVSITGNGNEIYYTLFNGEMVTIMVVRRIRGVWYQPVVAEFARDTTRYFAEPSVSQDGTTIFFLSANPGWKDQDIWISTRKAGATWSKPVRVPGMINTAAEEFFPSVARNGNLYFTRRDTGTGKSSVMVAKWKGDHFQDPVDVALPADGISAVYNASIEPDEQFLVSCATIPGDGNQKSHSTYTIFFHNPDGSWSKGIDMVKILSLPCKDAISISVSPDGQYIFYASTKRLHFYREFAPGWKASAIHRQRNLPGNGNADIYWFDFRKVMFRL